MRSFWIRPILLLTLLSLAPTAAVAGKWVWKEFEKNQARILELTRLQGQKSQEMVALHGRNDTPEALAVLTPIRQELQAARAKEAHLLCWDRPKVANLAEFFESMNLPLERRRVDHQRLMRFVKQKVADKTLTRAEGRKLRFTLGQAGHGVMNPSSRGASQINHRIAQALRCYGLDKDRAQRADGARKLHYFRSCGDHVCRDDGYRGPTPEVPVCKGQKVGARCSTAGERCDLQSNCNILLICAEQDPSTRCAR